MTTTDLYGIEGQVLDGQFRVDRAIGEGGFSVVYRGLHIGLDEPVAIKCLKLQAPLQSSVVDGIVRRFRDESKIHYRLSRGSLHIARTIAAGTTMAPATGALVPYMVLEWLEGYTLSEELRARRMRGETGRSLPEVIRLLDPVADAMAFAHAQGVVHRDLNPSNIFVAHSQGTSKLKVLDFGVAKVISDHALSLGPRVATIGQIRMFTPAYAAPEQFHDALGAIGPQTDVYSFAVLVVELLADRAPIEGEHIGEYADRALDPGRRPTPRSMGVHVGDAVEAVLARAVTVDPSQRPRDIGEFWGMLKNAATRDANQSRGVGELGFPSPPVMAAPSARGADLSKVTAGGLPAPAEPRSIAGPTGGSADLVPDTRGTGWRPQAGDRFANTAGPARPLGGPALDETMEAQGRAGSAAQSDAFSGQPRRFPGVRPNPPHTAASPLPLPPIAGGISSNTAFAATMATPGSPAPAPTPSPPSLHLGDTAPSAVLRSPLPQAPGAKPAARWYTPSLEGNTPFPPSSPRFDPDAALRGAGNSEKAEASSLDRRGDGLDRRSRFGCGARELFRAAVARDQSSSTPVASSSTFTVRPVASRASCSHSPLSGFGRTVPSTRARRPDADFGTKKLCPPIRMCAWPAGSVISIQQPAAWQTAVTCPSVFTVVFAYFPVSRTMSASETTGLLPSGAPNFVAGAAGAGAALTAEAAGLAGATPGSPDWQPAERPATARKGHNLVETMPLSLTPKAHDRLPTFFRQ